MKQKEYRETYSLAQNAPYQIGDDAYKEHHGVAAQWFLFRLTPRESASSSSTLGS